MPDFSNKRIGGAILAPHDPRNIKLEALIDFSALPPIPDDIDLSTRVADYGMHKNDAIGDCVPAAGANQIEADSADVGTEQVVPDADVITAYSVCGGYVQGDSSTDNGTDPQVFMKYWRDTGLGGRKIYAYATVDKTNVQLLKAAMWLCGGLQVTLTLPNSAKRQAVWDVVPNDGGVWGGHQVCSLKRNAAGLYTVETWDTAQPMTQAFLNRYGYLVFAAIPMAWFDGTGKAPNGFNVAQLERYLAIVSGQPDPGPPQPVQTTTVLSVAPNPATTAQPVTLRAAVAGSNPTGAVAFTLDGQSIAAGTMLANGAAQSTIAGIAPGSHTVTAQYGGDAGNAPSQAATVTLAVTEPQPVVDPYVLAWCQWQADDAAYVLDRLKRGDTAGALAQEKLLSANAPGIATLLAGAKSAGFSATPPAVPS